MVFNLVAGWWLQLLCAGRLWWLRLWCAGGCIDLLLSCTVLETFFSPIKFFYGLFINTNNNLC